MAITLKRQISDDEKKIILERYGRRCFATGHDIAEGEPIQFDHVKAYANKGSSEIDNIAPMCDMHNKQKGRLSLYDFRVKLKMDEFFSTGDSLTLKDQLEFFKRNNEITQYGNSVYLNGSNDSVDIEIKNKKITHMLYHCPITNWKYFYATLPIDVLDSDDDKENEIGLQPRYLIPDKVFNLFRHFQNHPVLQPSICRLNKNKILVFDGQHKIAALLWDGRREFECKVYIDPDPALLNITNISAHDKFAQTRFYSSIMVAKLGSQFGKEFDEYKNIEDNGIKSEAGFLEYIKDKEQLVSTADLNKRFKSFLYNSILEDEDNKMTVLVNKGNRGSLEKPITMDMLDKSLFSQFLYRFPVSHDMTTDKYLREYEIKNNIRLFNIIYDEALCNWDGTRPSSDLVQMKYRRVFSSKSIMAWSELLHDAICARLKLNDSEDREMPFYRIMSDNDFEDVRFVVRRLIEWNKWDSPLKDEIDRMLVDNKSEVKQYFKSKGLTTGYLMGAPE